MHNLASVERQLQELELALLLPSVRKSERAAELLADGFVEFGSSGRTFTKQQVLASLAAEAPTERTPSQLKVKLLSPEVALVTYQVCRGTAPGIRTLRSSIWQCQDEQWRMVFHQGTPTSEPE